MEVTRRNFASKQQSVRRVRQLPVGSIDRLRLGSAGAKPKKAKQHRVLGMGSDCCKHHR